MSLVKTLAKVAIGVAIAKGATSMMKNAKAAQPGSAGDGGRYGGEYSRDRAAPGGTGLDDLLGGVLGGKTGGSLGQTGGLGGMLEGLQQNNPDTVDGGLDDLFDKMVGEGEPLGRAGGTSSGGGLADILGQLAGGSGSSGGMGGLGDLLGGLAGAAAGGRSGGFGDMLNDALAQREPKAQPTAQQDAAAALMIRAMIQAARSDGSLDGDERKSLTDQLGDMSRAERDYVDHLLRAPVDAEGLARDVPRGLEQQVYAVSVMAIDLDNRNEAQYLDKLARGMGLGQSKVNSIHDQLGEPRLYR